jgi:hypothetical protein
MLSQISKWAVWEYIGAVAHHWGTLVTGGVAIGVLGIWQGTGHSVPRSVYWCLGLIALFISCFRAWLAERKAKDKAIAELNVIQRHGQEKASFPLPAPALPLPVDLRGDLSELYFRKDNDLLGMPSRTTVVMKVQIVNHGPTEATITHCGLQIRIGEDQFSGDLVKHIPDSWRIKKRKDGLLNIAYEESPFDVSLGVVPHKEVYRRGIPLAGWLAFEFYFLENVEFPNAQFILILKDSLGGEHRVQKDAALYIKTGEIVTALK